MKERILLILSLILVLTATPGFVSAQTRATKTVTNADLEKFRQKRLEAEADYRANYEKLGMPSPEELERREAERRRWHAEFSERAEAERAQSENYFLARADELKTQIASVDAQINYLRGQVGEPSPYKGGTIVYGSGLVLGGFAPVYGGNFHRGGIVGRGFRTNRGAVIGPNAQTVGNYANSFPNAASIRNQANGAYARQRLNRFPRNRYGSRNYYGGGYVTPFAGGAYAESDSESRLSHLRQQRAGLIAEWQALEEEARRAGVRID
ncbi:MAG TPA: hypothetical protein VK400_16355 [Pyrinomonadaceae bacterium]|nr:hypothetical protein [Pyrinomonadaceae bacterium]